MLSQEAKCFPDWGKMEFYKYPAKPWSEVLSDASDDARDLVSKLIRYQSSDRLEASKVFSDIHDARLLNGID